MSTIYVGIDLSITSPGICILCDESTTLLSASEHLKDNVTLSKDNYSIILMSNRYRRENKDIDPFKRIKHNAEEVVKILNMFLLKLKNDHQIEFYIEGYSYGAVGMIFNIAEMTGIVKYLIEKTYNTHVTVIQPTTIKKYATGKGNANKELMVDSLITKDLVMGSMFETIANSIKGKSKKNFIYLSPLNDIADAYHIAHYAKDSKQ